MVLMLPSDTDTVSAAQPEDSSVDSDQKGTDELETFMRQRRAAIVAACQDACAQAGRSFSEVTLEAVSKTVDVATVIRALHVGYDVFGENRPQELTRKLDALHAQGETLPRFDMIGNLQTNKINQVLGRATLIHSISSVHLAEAVSMRAQRSQLRVPVLLECNISGEDSKSGFAPDELRAALDQLMELAGIDIEGLMTMAPAHNPDAARATFSGLRELAVDVRQRTGLSLPTLSCGMSDDFKIAIEEGSTLIRLGRVVFSPDYSYNG